MGGVTKLKVVKDKKLSEEELRDIANKHIQSLLEGNVIKTGKIKKINVKKQSFTYSFKLL